MEGHPGTDTPPARGARWRRAAAAGTVGGSTLGAAGGSAYGVAAGWARLPTPLLIATWALVFVTAVAVLMYAGALAVKAFPDAHARLTRLLSNDLPHPLQLRRHRRPPIPRHSSGAALLSVLSKRAMWISIGAAGGVAACLQVTSHHLLGR